MMSKQRISAGIVAAVVVLGSVVYANPLEGLEGLCAGLAAAIERSSGLAKLILEVIAGFFGC
jgi:hypothetical protein